MSLGLAVDRWSFWSPVAGNPCEWLEQDEPATDPIPAKEVPADLVPPMHRRRMSASSRMGVQVALRTGGTAAADYLVFCSRHGEVERSESLIETVMTGTELSPTDFSLSVHNTTAGLYGIITNCTAPSTSIASGAASFACGWLEAEAFIHRHPNGRVLLVEHQAPLPEIFRRYVPHGHMAYALALVITAAAKSDGVRLDLLPPVGADEKAMGPRFLSWWLTGASTLTVSAEQQGFRWTR